jgi:hypothetical protein
MEAAQVITQFILLTAGCSWHMIMNCQTLHNRAANNSQLAVVPQAATSTLPNALSHLTTCSHGLRSHPSTPPLTARSQHDSCRSHTMNSSLLSDNRQLHHST